MNLRKKIITDNMWSKISSGDRAYASFFSFARMAIVLLMAMGSGIILPNIISKVLPIINKIGVDFRIVDIIIWMTLIGILITAFILLLRLNELAATAVIAISIVIDSYLSLFFVSLILALVILLFFFLGRSSRYPWVAPRALWLWSLFLVLAILPATQTIIPFDGFQYYLNDFLEAFILFWLGTEIARNITRVRYLFRLLAVFGAFIAIVTIIQTITGLKLTGRSGLQGVGGYRLGTSGVSRPGAFLINPNPDACFLAMMLLIVFGLLFDESTILGKAFYLILAFLILLAMLFTYSTEGLLGALAGIIVFIALVGSMRSRIFLILLILGIITFAITSLPMQVSLLLQHASNPDELSLRNAAWQTGIRVIEAFPLTGVGLGGYVYRVRAEPYRIPAQSIVLDHPHNSYLEFAALAGLPVLIVFLILLLLSLGFALQNWMQADKSSRTLLGAGIAVVIVLSFVSLSDAAWTFPPVAALGWLMLGGVSSPLHKESRKNFIDESGGIACPK